jgi:membrane protein required for colicin V production
MDSLPINLTDAVIVLVIVLSGFFAFFRGFVHEFLAIASWVGAAAAALYGFPYLQPEMRKLIASPLLADMAAGIAIFLVVLIVLTVLTRLLARRVRDSSLGPLDRSLGLLFGFLRGAVLICIAWILFLFISPREDHPDWITEARSLPLVERGSAILVSMIPPRLRARVEEPRVTTGGGTGADAGKAAQGAGFEAIAQPRPKGGAPEEKAGYKAPERDAMRRLIEATTQPEAEKPRQ